MQTTIVGSGPAGMVAALLLARQGHAVTLVDRDPGPGAAPSWDKRERLPVPATARLPPSRSPRRCPNGCRRCSSELLAADPVISAPPGMPAQRAMLGLRREVFDRVLWRRSTASRA